MTWFNELHVMLQVYLSGVIFVFLMYIIITTYGKLAGKMKSPLYKLVIGFSTLSLFSWVGLVITLIVFTIGLSKQIDKNRSNNGES